MPISPRVFRLDAGHQDALFVFPQLRCNFDHLRRCLAGAKNDFGKTLPQRPVRVHLRETQIGQRRNLESPHDLGATHSARAEFLQ